MFGLNILGRVRSAGIGISSVTPDYIDTGTVVTIIGHGFGTVAGTLTIEGEAKTAATWEDGEITWVSDIAGPLGDYTVEVENEFGESESYTVNSAPVPGDEQSVDFESATFSMVGGSFSAIGRVLANWVPVKESSGTWEEA